MWRCALEGSLKPHKRPRGQSPQTEKPVNRSRCPTTRTTVDNQHALCNHLLPLVDPALSRFDILQKSLSRFNSVTPLIHPRSACKPPIILQPYLDADACLTLV
jgi:hypothetical protein